MRDMKIVIFLSVATIYLTNSAVFSQITITQSDLMIVGTDINMYLDTNAPSLDFMGSATNQNWDFSTVVSDIIIQSDIVSPTGQAKANLFPTATAAIHRFGFNTQYYENTNNAGIFLGTVITVLDTQVYYQNYNILEYPATLGSQYMDAGDKNKGIVFPLGFDPDLTGPHPFVDSTTSFSVEYYESNIDAYGMVKTPVAEYNVLRQYITITTIDSAFMYANGKWQPMSALLAGFLNKPLAKVDTTFAYGWIAKGMSLPVCNIEFDPNNNNKILTVQWTNLIPVGIAENKATLPFEVYPNPADDVLNIKNTGMESMTFRILSQGGEEVVRGVLENSVEIKIDFLAPGIYFLRVENNKGEIEVRKIVKG